LNSGKPLSCCKWLCTIRSWSNGTHGKEYI